MKVDLFFVPFLKKSLREFGGIGENRESSWHLERIYQRPLSDWNQGYHLVQRAHAAEVGTL